MTIMRLMGDEADIGFQALRASFNAGDARECVRTRANIARMICARLLLSHAAKQKCASSRAMMSAHELLHELYFLEEFMQQHYFISHLSMRKRNTMPPFTPLPRAVSHVTFDSLVLMASIFSSLFFMLSHYCWHERTAAMSSQRQDKHLASKVSCWAMIYTKCPI